jgi:GntR family transcriptional regulator
MSVFVKATFSTATEVVADQLRATILSGALEPGSQLPSEKELVDALGVSRATLRESLRTLENQGLIIRRHGVGTFVRSHSILKNLNVNHGISDMIASAGSIPGTSHLIIREEQADADLAESLNIEPNANVVVVERVRVADDRPVVYSLDIFARSLTPKTAEGLHFLRERSIYEYFHSELNLTIHHGIAKLSAVKADRELSRHLGICEGSALLYIRQVDYLSDEQPVLLSIEYHVPDAFEVIVYRTGPGGAGDVSSIVRQL